MKISFQHNSSPSTFHLLLSIQKKNLHNLLNFNKRVHHHYNRRCRCKAGALSPLKMFVLFGMSCACSENFPPLQTILDKNLETLWKILLPFVFPLLFAMLLYPPNFAITSQHCRGKGTCIVVSRIFGEDCGLLKRKRHWIVVNSYRNRTSDLLTRSSKTNYKRTTGQLTIWLTIDDFLTEAIDGSRRTNYESSYPITSRLNWQTTDNIAT